MTDNEPLAGQLDIDGNTTPDTTAPERTKLQAAITAAQPDGTEITVTAADIGVALGRTPSAAEFWQYLDGKATPEFSAAVAEAVRRRKEAPRVSEPAPPTGYIYPLSKAHHAVFTGLEEKKKTAIFEGNGATSYIAISFDALRDAGIKIPARFTAFDNRVFCVTWTLAKDMQPRILSARTVARYVFNRRDPAQSQVYRVQDSLRKMLFSAVQIDNRQLYELHRVTVTIDAAAPILEGRIYSAYIDGQYCNSVIDLRNDRAPLLIRAAEATGQITVLPRAAFHPAISITERSTAIIDAVYRRVNQITHTDAPGRKKSGWNIVTVDGICSAANLKRATQRNERRDIAPIQATLDALTTAGTIAEAVKDPENAERWTIKPPKGRKF